jgi:hypothetical protein
LPAAAEARLDERPSAFPVVVETPLVTAVYGGGGWSEVERRCVELYVLETADLRSFSEAYFDFPANVEAFVSVAR